MENHGIQQRIMLQLFIVTPIICNKFLKRIRFEDPPMNTPHPATAKIMRMADYMSKEDLLDSLSSITRKQQSFSSTMNALREASYSPDLLKQFNRRWRISQAAEMVGRSVQSIRRKEAEGALPEPEKDEKGRRQGYTLEDINRMRDVFGTRPGRDPEDEPAIISFSNFKGGAGKSTLAIHFSQYLALKGLRVLVVDVDPQGTLSTIYGADRDVNRHLFEAGLIPHDPTPKYGLEHYYAGTTDNFADCVSPSYFPGVDICPSAMALFNAEYSMSKEVWADSGVLTYLGEALRQVEHNYDVIIFDAPPALGFLSLSVLAAANAIVVPMRPSVYDFASTDTFFTMLKEQVRNLIELGFPIHYYFESLAINHMLENKGAHVDITGALRSQFALEDFFPSPVLDSAEIDNASMELKTFYDLDGPLSSHRVYTRCRDSLEGLFSHIEEATRRIWKTHSNFRRQLNRVGDDTAEPIDNRTIGSRA
jgi:chromosome partitioning protein